MIIQVGSFKMTGQRVFKMAPLHHHFELIGWSEPKVITRFVIVAIIFALVQPDDVEAQMTTRTLDSPCAASASPSSGRRAAASPRRSCSSAAARR